MKCHWTMNLRISSKWWWREAYTQNASSKDAQEKRKTYIFSIDLTTQIFLRYYFFRVKKHNMLCLICKYNFIQTSKEMSNTECCMSCARDSRAQPRTISGPQQTSSGASTRRSATATSGGGSRWSSCYTQTWMCSCNLFCYILSSQNWWVVCIEFFVLPPPWRSERLMSTNKNS